MDSCGKKSSLTDFGCSVFQQLAQGQAVIFGVSLLILEHVNHYVRLALTVGPVLYNESIYQGCNT